MGTNKLAGKLEGFFDQSRKKQENKRDKLLKIIEKLERKKARLGAKLMAEGKLDDTSVLYQDLSKELKVVSELIKKGKKKALSYSGDEASS